MAESMKKGALPPDPRVVIPKLEDYLDVSSLTSGPPAATGIIDRESKVNAWPMHANRRRSGGVMFSDSRNVQG
jgi:hypothetical protein